MYRFWIIFILFFISGGSGLIYQVVWSRMMGLIFGRSVLAVGIVLAAFMGGLALGSYLLGKRSDRSRNPLKLYALYELGIGVTALAASILLMNISPVYVRLHEAFGGSSVALSAARFLIAFTLILVPTILMGATLPILSRVVIKRLDRVGNELGKLYAINTLGAVAGTVAAGFFLIRWFGLYGAIFTAVTGNLGVGILAWVVSGRPQFSEGEDAETSSPDEVIPEVPAEDLSGWVPRILLFVFAMSGLASFSYEIFWTRSLVFVLGNTTYAFTLMLTAFLTGIALGGYGIRFLADRVSNRLLLFAVIEILIGLLSAASLPILFYILDSQWVQSVVLRMSGRFELLVLSESAVALVVMLLPATLIGATLPLMGRIFVADLKSTGATVGKVYAVNTVGNVIGALVPGLVILPLLGIQRGILLMAVMNICLGVMVLLAGRRRYPALAWSPAAVFLVFSFTAADIQPSFQFPSESQTKEDAVLYYEEGGLVTTKVWAGANSGRKMISVDGINIGGTNDADYKQQILAHLPKLLIKSYESELSIGLGSGILIGESARHDQLKRIVCAEIAPSVVRGAGYFEKENHGILGDPRTEIVVDDIGHFLRTTKEKFDIISSDGKTDEKYSSNAFTYSKEYYRLLGDHLAPGGLVIQWIPTALPSSYYHLVLRTFLDSFEHVTLWYFPPVNRFFLSNTFLVGSKDRIRFDPAWMDQVLAEEAASFDGIRKYGLKNVGDVLAHFIAGGETLRRMVPEGPVNSFQWPHYEFYSPEDFAVPTRKRVLVNHDLFVSMRGPDFEGQVLAGRVGPLMGRLKAAFEAEGIFLEGHRAQLAGEPYTKVLGLYGRALDRYPEGEVLRSQIVSYLVEQFRVFQSRGDYANALGLLRLAVQVNPESAEAREDYGMMLWFTNQPESAIEELERALELNPDLVFARRVLGEILVSRGETEEAVDHWREVLRSEPDDIGTLVTLGVHLARTGSHQAGEKHLARAYALAPGNPEVIHGYALVLFLAGDLAGARQIVKAGGRYYEENQTFTDLRSKILNGAR